MKKIIINLAAIVMLIGCVACSKNQALMLPPPGEENFQPPAALPVTPVDQSALSPMRAARTPVPNNYDFAVVSANKRTSYKIFHYMPESSKSQGTESRISEISKEVAGKVFYQLKDDGEKNLTSTVAVVGAVPLSDLKRETEFGRLMAEFLLTDLADRGMKVTELRLGREINIMEQGGEYILSRNLNELANSTPELNYVVVSTFSNTRKTLIVQGRLVNLRNGLVKTSWRYTMPLTKELLGLFHSIEPPFTIAVKGN